LIQTDSLGANVNGLESDLEVLAEDCSVGALSSGTAAIHGLILLGVEAGDTVICQSMTFQHLQIQYCILSQPCFIDSEIETWNLCPFSFRGINNRQYK
jgi:dTDP-4-amino-4,6-dideoxygalactose transaminase